MIPKWIHSVFIFQLLVEVYSTRTLAIGPDAQRICRSYQKVCGPGRFCAMRYSSKSRNFSRPVCVSERIIPVAEPTDSTNFCNLQVVKGGCKARYIRWFFDANEKECKWFTYGGCDGNKNNFRSKGECEKACPVHTANDIEVSRSNRAKPIALPVRSPMKISQPILFPRTNQVSRSLTLVRSNRSHDVSRKGKGERRRKRRLRKRNKRRLQKLRRRRRRLLMRGKKKKKRRDGKTHGKRRKNKNRKRRKKKNRKKKRKNKKVKTDFSSRQEVLTTKGPVTEVTSTKRGNPPKTLTILQDVESEINKINDGQR